MILKVFLGIFGIFEILTSVFHFRKLNKNEIGKSGRIQHQELPKNISNIHYFYKVIIMFVFGIIFLLCSVLIFIENPLATNFTFIAIMCFSLYALIQTFLYLKEIKVWGALIAYNIPLLLLILKL